LPLFCGGRCSDQGRYSTPRPRSRSGNCSGRRRIWPKPYPEPSCRGRPQCVGKADAANDDRSRYSWHALGWDREATEAVSLYRAATWNSDDKAVAHPPYPDRGQDAKVTTEQTQGWPKPSLRERSADIVPIRQPKLLSWLVTEAAARDEHRIKHENHRSVSHT
jgi:hypothetical protein